MSTATGPDDSSPSLVPSSAGATDADRVGGGVGRAADAEVIGAAGADDANGVGGGVDTSQGAAGAAARAATAGPPARRRPVAPIVAVAVALVVGALVVVFARSDGAGDSSFESPVVGEPAPLLIGATTGGGTYDLGARRGRWVVVNFMASWCGPCRQEQPELELFSDRHAAAGDAEVVAVVVNDEPDDIDAFFAQYGGDWPAVLDPDGEGYVDFGVVKVPETFVVDPDGIVVAKVDGAVSAAGLDAVLVEAATARAGG